MSEIKVTNTSTSKSTSKELNPAAMLTEARKALGAFMAASDVFVDTEGESLTGDLEKEVKLEEIVKDGAISVAAGSGGTDATPGDGTAPGGEPPAGDTPSGGKPPAGGTPDGGGTPKTDSPGTKHPANAAPSTANQGNLEPKVLPDAQWAADHVGLVDGLKDGEAVEEDSLNQMKVGQVRNLLRKNGIDLNLEQYGLAAAFVDNGLIFKHASIPAMRCTQVNVTDPQMTRYTRISCQYSEDVSRLHRMTTAAGNASVGVPGIFNVGGSFQTTRVTNKDTRVVKEHKAHSHLIPKARVVFRQDKVSLSEEFVKEIEAAVKKGDAAPALLSVLARYGQWFATETLLGGRLDYWTDKTMEETHTEEQDRSRFQYISNARAQIDGVPVQGEANWSTGLDDVQKQSVVRQAHSLSHLLLGGNANTVTPEKWIPSLAKYLNWQIAGFDALVPTIAYLQDDALRSRCIKVLREYFTSKLEYRQTIKVGAMDAPPFGEDIGSVKRIVQIEVDHGLNVDGLKVTYELTNGQRKEMPWVGWLHGDGRSVVGPLEFDEEIVAVQTWSNDILRRIAFKTSKGRRFPASPNEFYGRGTGGEMTYAELEAPRVCGLVGNSVREIASIGLRYRDLDDDLKYRSFLTLLEPYLFPINVPSRIDMTVRGILLAGGWRGDDGLVNMSTEEKRNTLIVELGGHSTNDGPYFWGLSDAELVKRGAVVVFLLTSGLRDRAWLKAHSCAEHRTAVIQLIHNALDEPIETLQKLSESELVRWGDAIRRNRSTASA